jgi:hypothetical protein
LDVNEFISEVSGLLFALTPPSPLRERERVRGTKILEEISQTERCKNLPEGIPMPSGIP